MKIQDKVKTLRRMGIDISDFEIELLGSLYDISGGFSKWATAAQVWQQVTSRTVRAKQLSKAWVYRGLKELSAQGFVLVDQISRPARYMITRESLAQGVEGKKRKKESELLETRGMLSERIASLGKIDAKTLATDMINYLKGERLGAKSGVIEGIDNVRAVIDQEIINRAQEGDVIWTINPISILNTSKFSSTTDRKLLEASSRGVKVKGLVILTGEGDIADISRLSGYVKNMAETVQQIAQLGNLEIVAVPPGIQTYRLLGLNRERILLYLTNVAHADTTALIRYEDNPIFIEDAYRTFEALWKRGKDFFRDFLGHLETAKV